MEAPCKGSINLTNGTATVNNTGMMRLLTSGSSHEGYVLPHASSPLFQILTDDNIYEVNTIQDESGNNITTLSAGISVTISPNTQP